MNNWIVTYFESLWAPQTGLAALVYVRDLSDGSVVVDGAAMSEIGNGWYKFNWANGTQAADYDKAKDYVGYCDSQNADSDDRYIPIEFEYISEEEPEGGGWIEDDWRYKEEDEFIELMHMLSAAGVLN